MRFSDTEEANLILKAKGYQTRQVVPELRTDAGLVVFLDPVDIQCGCPGAFGVVRLTAEDIIRHCHDPCRRTEGLALICDRAENDFLNFRRRWTNR
ncbi:MAG: hypothetical protein ACR2RF_24810 [Geminicoccaceae bacterium]